MNKILEAMAMWETAETLFERDRWETRTYSNQRQMCANARYIWENCMC